MTQHDDIDKLLKQALTPPERPSHELNQSIIFQIRENTTMRKKIRKPALVPVLATILTLLVSFSALAAWKILSPGEIAQELDDTGLARAFQGEDAIEINETIVSGEYNISLIGIVSGEDLSDFKGSPSEIYPDRTYAVVAIANEDGSPMPHTSDDAYADLRFFISPLIKGEKPWEYNIASMNGSYTETVIDGVMYRLIECDDIEIFADRVLYLCVSNTSFYSVEAFNYDEETGVISPNPDFDGVNALFDLPLDISKANPEEAERYLKELFFEEPDVSTTPEEGTSEDQVLNPQDKLDILMESAVLIPESVKEVSYTEKGFMVYEYETAKIVCDVRWIFADDETGFSDAVSISEHESETWLRRFHRDENGVITGMFYRVAKDNKFHIALTKARSTGVGFILRTL